MILFHHAIIRQAQIRKLDRVAIAENDGARENVFEFAHVPRPRVTEQSVESAKGKLFRQRLRSGVRFENVMREQKNIAAAFP